MNKNAIEIASIMGNAIWILITMVIFFFWFANYRSRNILHTWAKKNGFQILHFKQTGRNPFGLTTGGGQTIYSVRIRDKAGRERSGFVRCGDFFTGVLFGDDADVKWKDENS